MSEAPEKIWVDSQRIAWEQYSKYDIPYIRADLLDELVEALEYTAELLEALGGTTHTAQTALAKVKGERNEC